MQAHTGKGYTNEGSLKSWTPAFVAFAASERPLAPAYFVGRSEPLQRGLRLPPADASVHRNVAMVGCQTAAAERSPAAGRHGDPSLNPLLSYPEIMVQFWFLFPIDV